MKAQPSKITRATNAATNAVKWVAASTVGIVISNPPATIASVVFAYAGYRYGSVTHLRITDRVAPSEELISASQAIQETLPLTQQALIAVSNNIIPSQMQIDQILAAIDDATPALGVQRVTNKKIDNFIRDLEDQLGSMRMRFGNWGRDQRTRPALLESIRRFEQDILKKHNALMRCYLAIKEENERSVEWTAFQAVVNQADSTQRVIDYLSSYIFAQEPIDPDELIAAIEVLEKLVNTIYDVVRP